MALRRDRGELLGQEARTVAAAHQDGDALRFLGLHARVLQTPRGPAIARVRAPCVFAKSRALSIPAPRAAASAGAAAAPSIAGGTECR